MSQERVVSSNAKCLALDFGASSCRLVGLTLENNRLVMHEIYRMPNGPEKAGDQLVWPLELLAAGTVEALKKAGAEEGCYESIGVDTWGVDYVLLDKDNVRFTPPVAYRDSRTEGLIDKYSAEVVSRGRIYAKTGIQFLPFNTLYQLYAQTLTEPEVLQQAGTLLFIADYFHFLLTGKATIEKTNASTSQMWNLNENCWDKELVDSLALPGSALPEPIEAGTEIGRLIPALQEKTGLSALRVIAPATHDTGSAVLAVPASGENWAYLSSGTWSLLGIETDTPITTQEALQANWTNEGGYGNTFRFLKNITGLWIIQEIARVLENRYSFAELAAMAQQEEAYVSLINPDDASFFSPDNMIDAIRQFCRKTGQEVPETAGQLVRCAYDSLSLLYRKTLEDLKTLTGKTIDVLHVVGGGSQADFLNQLTAASTGIPVLAGPVEATALGNGLAQFLTTGAIGSLAAGRALIAESFPLKRFNPEPISNFEEIYQRFMSLCLSQSNEEE